MIAGDGGGGGEREVSAEKQIRRYGSQSQYRANVGAQFVTNIQKRARPCQSSVYILFILQLYSVGSVVLCCVATLL